MEKIKLLVIPALVALLVTLAAVAIKGPAIVTNTIEKVVGAVTSPDLYSSYWNVNGVQTYYYSTTLRTGTTTLCSFISPASTSTLLFASAKFTTGSSTASSLAWGKASVPDATTTSLGTGILAANVQGVFQASTTANGLVATNLTSSIDDSPVIAPSNYVNLKYGNSSCTAGGTCNAFVGTCKVEFIVN